MDLDSVRKAYARWSHLYDWVFGPAFGRARRRAIEMLELTPGDRVLEVGVGTGLSLPAFPEGVTVMGIDISRPMLCRAVDRARRTGSSLVEGDAARLPWPDDCFDAALASYVVSAAPEPTRMLREIARVCRPGAPVVLLNHVVSDSPPVAALERLVAPVTRKLLGFHADFRMEPVLVGTPLRVVEGERVPPLGYWKALRCEIVGREAA